MKKSLRSICLFLLAILLLAFPAAALAAGNPRLELAAHPAHVRVGDTFTVEVRVRNTPPVYGADVRVTFDPQVLEVVDADTGQEGIQISSGDFIDLAQSFVLRHAVDNQQGTIDYILALLNPAPEAHGNGTLMTITFRAKASGTTTISIASGMFGTRAGDTLVADLDTTEIRVTAGHSRQSNTTQTLLLAGITGIGIVIGGVVLFRRRRV